MMRPKLAILSLAVAGTLVACGGPDESRLSLLAEKCEASTTVSDEGKTLLIVAYGTEESTESIADEKASCLIEGLNPPKAVIAHLNDTSAIQGRQTDSWDDYDASWTYHPDNGLSLIIKDTK